MKPEGIKDDQNQRPNPLFFVYFFYRKEVEVITKTNNFRSFNMSMFFTSSKMIVFLALLTYILTGNVLTAEKVRV